MTAKQHASRAVRSFGIAIVVTVGVVAAILLAIALDDGGADLSYKTLDYDVQVQSNGDLKITQHIDMKLADRSDDDGDHPWKQLYQQYAEGKQPGQYHRYQRAQRDDGRDLPAG